MEEVIELSSSDDENYNSNLIKNNLNNDTFSDMLYFNNKYNSINKEETVKPAEVSISLSSSDDECDELSNLRSVRERLQNKYNIPFINENRLIHSNDEHNNELKDILQSTSQTNCENNNKGAPKPKKIKTTNEEKLLKKLDKEREKALKEKAKAEKKELATAYKNLKPEECLKFIIAIIDSHLLTSECGKDIPNALQNANISYQINTNEHPFTVTWKRNNPAHLTSVDGQLQITKNEDYCEEVLLILVWDKFIKLIHENDLISHFKAVQSLFPNKKVYLGIYGIAKYFSLQKSRKQHMSRKEKTYTDSPQLSRSNIDMALIELQIIFGASHRFLNSPEDLSAMIYQFTKSIAQIPYKLQKQTTNEQLDWYAAGDNKDCVKVDKSGNGLYRLWRQQLTQLNLARLETAEAIASKYPTPSSLMKAYDECKTTEEGEKLLQDIPIRRAAGPLTSVRKIGPEFSKKIYTLFTATNGDIVL